MYKSKCRCLNTTIHVQKGSEREADGKTMLTNTILSPFFAGHVLEVKLAVGGITKEVDMLIHKSHLEDWDIYRCLNCNTDVYALHSIKGYDRVLVNKDLETNPEVIKELSSSLEFSPAFKIIIKREKQELSNDEENAVLVSKDQLLHSMNSIQDALKKYLNIEEYAMNKRIEEYTAQQKQLFAALKARAFQDKTAVGRVLSDAEANLMENSIHEAMDESMDQFSSELKCLHVSEHLQPSPHSNKHQYGHIKKDITTPITRYSVGSPLQHGSRSPGVQKRKPHSIPHKIHVKNVQPAASDADPLFALDGFNDDCEPFFESEEDEFSSSDNSFQSEETPAVSHNVRALRKPAVYSSSVPISLPITTNSHSWEDDDDDNRGLPEPSKIGESMKALARSVQYNTEEMFGELPRPRVFTEPRPGYW